MFIGCLIFGVAAGLFLRLCALHVWCGDEGRILKVLRHTDCCVKCDKRVMVGRCVLAVVPPRPPPHPAAPASIYTVHKRILIFEGRQKVDHKFFRDAEQHLRCSFQCSLIVSRFFAGAGGVGAERGVLRGKVGTSISLGSYMQLDKS